MYKISKNRELKISAKTENLTFITQVRDFIGKEKLQYVKL